VLEATEIDVEAVPVLDQRGAKTQATDHADAVGGGDRVEEHHEHVLQQLLEPLGVLRGLLLVLLQRLAGCDAGPLHIFPIDPRSQGLVNQMSTSSSCPRSVCACASCPPGSLTLPVWRSALVEAVIPGSAFGLQAQVDQLVDRRLPAGRQRLGLVGREQVAVDKFGDVDCALQRTGAEIRDRHSV
jgi:hypothetical protein